MAKADLQFTILLLRRLNHFSIAVIKHHDQVRVHDGGTKVWQQEQLRSHMSNSKQETHSTLEKAQVF